jgi:hypothetical protein
MTSRRRLVAAGTSVAALVLALAALFGSSAGGAPSVLQGFFATPTPTAPLAPGDDHVVVENLVPWGVLRLDGRQIDMASSGFGSGFDPSQPGPPYLVLPRGTHTLDYTAAPFPAFRCVVSVPPAPKDTCHGNGSVGFNDVTYRPIDLGARPSRLPPDQLAALKAAVQAALVFPAAEVAPGDHYARANGTVAAATGEWHATPIISLVAQGAGSNQMIFSDESCDPLCSGSSLGPDFGGSSLVWQVLAHADAEWRFTDVTGRQLDSAPIHDGQPGQPAFPTLFALDVGWDGTWSTTPSTTSYSFDFRCQPGMGRLMPLLAGGQGMGFETLTDASLSDGCLLTLVRPPNAPPGPGTPFVEQRLGSVLYRFGALVAVEDAAHKLAPQLPLASGHERAIAAALAATRPQQ